MTSAATARFDRDDVVRLASIAWIAVTLLGWWTVLQLQWDSDALLEERDYYCFYRAGVNLMSGDPALPTYDHEFVYPPVALPLVAPLAALGLRGSYVAMALVGSIAWLLGTYLVSRLGVASERRRATVWIAMLTAPSFFLSLHLGQLVGLYMLTLGGSLVLLARGQDRRAGWLAALLVPKPHYLLPLLLTFGALRRRRFIGVALVTTGVLLLFGAALGPDIWHGWWQALGRLASNHEGLADRYWKQFTLYAFLRAVLYDVDASGTLARLGYLGLLAGYGAAFWVVLRRRGLSWQRPELAARLASITVLGTCALNTYHFFYDGALLALPGATLWLAEGSWARPSLRRLAIACMILSWLLQLDVAFIHVNPPLAGVVTGIWLLIELLDLAEPRRARIDPSNVA